MLHKILKNRMNPQKNFFSRLLLFNLLLSLSLIFCAKPQHSNPFDPLYDGPITAVIKEEVKNLDENTNVTNVSTTANTVTIDYTGQAPDLSVGSILVGETGDGYLRKVKSVETSGSQIICTTEQAAITDAVAMGTIDTVISMPADLSQLSVQKALPNVSVEGYKIILSGTELYSEKGEDDEYEIKIYISEGEITFTPTFNMKLNIQNSKVESFETSVKPELKFKCNLVVYTSGNYNAENSVDLVTYKFTQVYLIYGFPVVAVYELTFSVGYEAEIISEGTIENNFNSKFSIQAGVQYDRLKSPKWSTIWKPSGEFSGTPQPKWDFSTEAMVKGYIKPKVRVMLYGLLGPFISIEPYLKWHGQANLTNDALKWSWEIFAGLTSEMGFEMEDILGLEIENPEPLSVTWEKTLFSQAGTIVKPNIAVSPTSLEFGNVALKKEKDLTLRITNSGFGPLEISGFYSTDTRFFVLNNPIVNPINGGEYKEIQVRYKPDDIQNANGVLQITNNTEKNPYLVNMSGSCANTAPIASFTITPDGGRTDTEFSFNASGSYDNEDQSASLLQARWRWNYQNDVVWDTPYNIATQKQVHKYEVPGIYTVMLEIKDTGGLTGTATKMITVGESTGIIKGIVTEDQTLNPLSGVTVQVFDANQLLITQFTVEYAGQYEIILPEYNGYIISFSKEGFYPEVFTGINIVAGQVYTKNVQLKRTFVLSLSPENVTLINSETCPFTCTVTYSDNTKLNVTNQSTWTTAPKAAGSINSTTGLFTAHSTNTGIETVKAEYQKQTVQTTVTVQAEPVTLTKIEISQKNVTINNGQTYQFHCKAFYSDGSDLDCTNQASWMTEPGDAGSINASTGLFTASANVTGTETVTVEYQEKMDQASVTVNSVLTGIEISPKTVTLHNSETWQFECNAVYSDDRKIDVTNESSWSLSPGVAGTITTPAGLFTADATASGTETVTVSYQGKSDQATVTVVASEHETGTVTDIDGNVYQTVKIGNQWWMAENLKVTRYRNGDWISNVTDATEWSTQTTGACCAYDNNESNVSTYGRLYNWHAVMDPRGLAPLGWHVPSDEEWKQLEIYLGMSPWEVNLTGWRKTNQGGKLKETGTLHWISPNEGATNESGFTALPGGSRDGGFECLGYYAFFWATDEIDEEHSFARYLTNILSTIYRSYRRSDKSDGHSIRCVQDDDFSKSLTSIEISPISKSMQNSETQQFTCTAYYSDLSSEDVTFSTTWYSFPGVAGVIDAGGFFTADAINTGLEMITAVYQEQIKSINVIVMASSFETGTCTDIDGNVYQTIKIGNQWWMAENLKVTHYRNGDVIPTETVDFYWGRNKKGAYWDYAKNLSYVSTYGFLYNGEAIRDPRGLAPVGWHVASDEDWKILEMYLGMSQSETDARERYRGTDEGDKLKESGTAHWLSPNKGASNQICFTALPGGFFEVNTGTFGVGNYAAFWTSSGGSISSYSRYLKNGDSGVFRAFVYRWQCYSIRCVRD